MSADKEVRFRFEGRDLSSPPGISLASALSRAGEYGLRSVDDKEQRGVFCGIGVCQECTVDIRGHGRVRACMTAVADSMDVRRAGRLAVPEAGPSHAANVAAPEAEEPDVLVIGGGAAGLTAAATLAEAGIDVVLLDERHVPGGQYYKQPVTAARRHRSLAHDDQIDEGAALLERARASGARILDNAEVWGAFAPGEFLAVTGDGTRTFRPKRTIVATGAYERGLPLPGWTLPGVMTSGAAQTMLKSYGELPGRRVLVSGNGPLNLQIAQELGNAGAVVVAVTELASSFHQRPGAAIGMLRHDAALTMRGIRIVAALKAAGIPMLHRHGLESVESASGGLRAWVGRFDGRSVSRKRSFDVDIVCTGFGFLPNNEILRNLGCRHDFDKAGGQLAVVRDADCETSVAGVYAAGDCCGLGGAPAAREEGLIAAAAVARSLAVETPSNLARDERAARQRLRSHRGFQAALWRMFAAPRLQSDLASDDTVICRCENVRLADVQFAMARGDQSIGAVKRRTRLGMGACQGRYCGPVAAHLLAERTDSAIAEFSFFAPRVPIKPTRIADIVGASRQQK